MAKKLEWCRHLSRDQPNLLRHAGHEVRRLARNRGFWRDAFPRGIDSGEAPRRSHGELAAHVPMHREEANRQHAVSIQQQISRLGAAHVLHRRLPLPVAARRRASTEHGAPDPGRFRRASRRLPKWIRSSDKWHDTMGARECAKGHLGRALTCPKNLASHQDETRREISILHHRPQPPGAGRQTC